MHILYHHRTMGRGAEGLHITSIVKAFEKLGHRVTVLSPPGIDPIREYGKTPLDKSSEKTSGLKTIWKIISRYAPEVIFEVLEIVYNIYALFCIHKLQSKERIDLIYERNAYFLFAGGCIASWMDIPFIVEANEVVGIKRARPLILKGAARKIEKFVFSQAKAVFTVSSFLRDKIILETPCQVYVSPNAVDPVRFFMPTRRDEIRASCNINDRIVLGFAGWFDWWDRLDLLLKAHKRLIDSGHTNISTLIIGDGLLLNNLKQMSKQLGIDEMVIFTGAVDRSEIIDYLDAIDIGVLPHSNDFGSPVILFELMALGKIIVAPDLAPIKDVIEDGVNGRIFHPLDLDNMVQTISDIIAGYPDTKNIGLQAREMTLKNHTWDMNASTIVACMR